jgi:4a-hydroxytetrahydrobiopterin dehydratase
MSREETESLAERSCVPCRGGVPPLSDEVQAKLLQQLVGWSIVQGHHLMRDFRFDDFVSALAFTNEAGRIAEDEGHHPEIKLGWGHAEVTIWTHKIDGLTESDFVLAAKLDTIEGPLPPT